MSGIDRYWVGCVFLSMACGATDDRASNENVEQSGATLLFSEHFEDGGLLQVVESDVGVLSYSVHAPIRSNLASQRLKESAGKETLAEIFSTIHPGSIVPTRVRELSDQLEDQRSRPAAVTHDSRPVPQVDIQDKSQSSFLANACVTVYGGAGLRYTPEQCKYVPAGPAGVSTSAYTKPLVDSNGGSMIDRCYGWNESSWTASMEQVPGPSGTTANGWIDTYPAGTWGWTSWGGFYTGVTARLQIGSHNGSLGITVHDATQDPM
jgi:hypothetical protein